MRETLDLYSKSETDAKFAATVSTNNLVWAGSIQVPDEIGTWESLGAEELTAVQVSAQQGPVGDDLTLEITKSGTGTGEFVIVPDGMLHGKVVFATPIDLAEGDLVTLVCTGVGSTSGGGFLTVTLVRRAVT